MEDDCREILHDLTVYLDGESTVEVEHLVTRHLIDCPPCMDRADFERQLRSLLARSCRVRAPQDVLDRVRARLDRIV
jgi:anti-sigma factor (TIGR02949 family)